MASTTRTQRRSSGAGAARARQQGSILFVSLIVLLLMFIGALFTLRGVLTDTGLTDVFSQRQKDTRASDLALQWAVSQIEQTFLSSQGQLLEISASGKPWFLSTPLQSQNPAAQTPSAAYWNTCRNAADAQHACAQATMPNGVTQQAWIFVEPTGRSDPSGCGNTQSLVAWYYDIWVHTVDARGKAGVDTESLYKLCVAQ